MRKTIFILLFAVAGSICSISHAACMGAATDVTGQTVTLSGELVWASYPCEGDGDCPDCLTIALDTDDNFYYLTTADNDLTEQMELMLEATVWQEPPLVTLSGIVYTRSNSNYLEVTALSEIADSEQTITLPATATPARKLLRGGHLLIQQGNNIYSPTGMQLESMRK